MTPTAPKPARPKPPNAGKGRPKGSVNKTTASVKEALALAYQGVGGHAALQQWAKANQTEFYKLWAKLLPQEVTAHTTHDGGLAVVFRHE